MVLTRQEKEKKILDLYNQGMTYKQIAETARVSLRDMNPVIKKAEKEREKELGINTQEENNSGNENRQTQKKTSTSTQAYRLFSEGKTPLEVAIELNIKQPEATRYCREYWKLSQMHTLNMVYEEIGDDIIHIPKVHRKIKEAGMGVDQAINLIKNANNDLSDLEQKYQKLKSDVDLLESRKLKEYQTLDQMQIQIGRPEKMLEWLEMSHQEEEVMIDELKKEEIRLKRLVKQFKDNNGEYLRIKRTVQNKIASLLLDGKDIMKVAINSLMESMRTDPQKYTDLINYNRSSSAENISWQFKGYIYRQHPFASFDNFYEEYKTNLLKDAENLY
ncbi:MAG TPA: hypothetical protein VKA91_05070, partial [Nitrososphaeraceae archaeon]|nr:hypothetical protein [Nitrososphaeraceae archaeon]